MISFEKSVGGIIYRKEDDKILFLLLHYQSGHWDYPKGHIEDGETEEQTLRRETEEETGITNLEIIPNFKEEIKYFYRAKGGEKEKRLQSKKKLNVAKKVVFYLAKTDQENVKISFEHIGFEWLEYGEAINRVTYKKSREILKKAWEFLGK